MATKGSILVVEDEGKMADLIREILEGEGYSVVCAKDGAWARQKIKQSMPDLLILDRKLPDMDGLDLCKELRNQEKTKSLPVLVVSAKGRMEDRVVGLKLGSDDYLPKPFGADELIARVEALIRRVKNLSQGQKVLQSGKLVVDLDQHKVFVKGRQVKLWPKEFELLQILLEKKNRVLTRNYLFERVWGNEYPGTTRTVDETIYHLRKKLGKYGILISTIKGYGYQYEEAEKR